MVKSKLHGFGLIVMYMHVKVLDVIVLDGKELA